jgi:thiamine-monophosphate kinase
VANEEFSLIHSWTKKAINQQGDGLSVGIGDDAAVFSISSGMELVACTDAMIETVHFLRETMAPEDVGYKSLISNFSDIAAMGGVPRFVLVTIGVPPTWSAEECQQIYEGMYEACALYGVRIIGGDTVATPDALHLSVTALGEVERGQALLRSSAKPGHLVFVTGRLGGSAAGLHALLEARDQGGSVQQRWHELLTRHRRPLAQVAAARLLIKYGQGGALNDVSDGLASELWEIAEASNVRVVVDQSLLPVEPDAVAYAESVAKDPLEWVLFGGEEYQLVGTVAPTVAPTLAQAFQQQGLAATFIGEVEQGEPGVYLKERQGLQKALAKAGYNHFRAVD